MVWPQSGCCLSGTTSVDRVIGSGPGIQSSVVDCQPPVSGRASEWRHSRSVGPRARGRRTEHSPPGGCRSGELLPSTRSATGELETSDYNYNTVINMSTTGSPTDWRVEKSNTSPHRVGGSFTNRRPSPSRPASPTPTHPLRCQPCWAARCPCSLPYPWRREAARARSFEARASSAPHRRPCPIR